MCGDNQKRCTPGFYRVNGRGFVPHARQSGAGVEETGPRIHSCATTVYVFLFYRIGVDMSGAVFEALSARINQLESKVKEYEQRQVEPDEKTQNEIFCEFLAIVNELMPLVNQALMIGQKDGDLHSR